MHIEQALIDRLGDTGRKLHTARSRNDQVSTDFRLWIREAIDRVDRLLLALQRTLSDAAKETSMSYCLRTPISRGLNLFWRPIIGWRMWRSSPETGIDFAIVVAA